VFKFINRIIEIFKNLLVMGFTIMQVESHTNAQFELNHLFLKIYILIWILT